MSVLSPPLIEAGADSVLADQTLFKSNFHQKNHSLTDFATRLDTEILNHRVAIHLRTERSKLFGFGQLVDAFFEFVHPA